MTVAMCAWLVDANGENRELDDSNRRIRGLCERVVDGDSLYIKGYDRQIRLWGVDAPEANEAGYRLAKNKLKALAKNKQLSCEVKDTDKYGRAVARCFPANTKAEARDQQEINRALIISGVASEYCYFSRGFYGHCAK